MLSVRQLHSYYEESHIIQGVNIEVPRASVVVLLGRNGVGKTTIIHNIIGFHRPIQGKILFKNINISDFQAYKITRMGMAIIPQGKRVFPSLSVKENLTIAANESNMSAIKYEINNIYSRFPLLKERSNHRADQLSGGEQQILAIARALIRKPDLVLMDEPFEGLAPDLINSIQSTIAELKETGVSILLAEHNIQIALNVSDYIYIINKGKCVYEGTTDQLKMEKEIVKKHLFI